MKKVFGPLIVIILLSGYIGSALADYELWSVNALQVPIKEKLKFNVIPEARFKNSASGFYYLIAYIGPSISINKNFDMNLYFAPKYQKNGSNWSASSLGFFDLIYKNDRLSNRARFEYDVLPNVLKYRNNLQFKMDKWSIGDEEFYNFSKGYIDEGRASVGYTCKINNELEFSLGCLVRRQRAADGWSWTGVVVNTGVKLII